MLQILSDAAVCWRIYLGRRHYEVAGNGFCFVCVLRYALYFVTPDGSTNVTSSTQ